MNGHRKTKLWEIDIKQNSKWYEKYTSKKMKARRKKNKRKK